MARPTGRSKDKAVQLGSNMPSDPTCVVGREGDIPADLHPMPSGELEGEQPSDPELSWFKHVVLAIDETNRVKKRLNLIKQSQQIDPSYTDPVSSDEEKDSIPDAVAFNHAV